MGLSMLLTLSVCAFVAAAVEAQIVVSPEDVEVRTGSSVLLPCVAYSSGPAHAAIAWLRDGAALSNATSPGRIILHAPVTVVKQGVVLTKAVLEVCGAREEDGGTYSCSVVGGEGEMADFELQVSPENIPVQIIVAPDNGNVLHNDSIILLCVAIGVPFPTITWNHNGNALSTRPHSTIEEVAVNRSGVTLIKSKLELCRTTPSDNGLYNCEASNGITTNIAFFQLIIPDDVQLQVVPAEFNEGVLFGDVSFTCEASGVPIPALSWTKNGVTLSSSSQYSMHDVSVGFAQSTLTIRGLGVPNSGNYACIASNQITTDTFSFHLSVNIPATAVVAPSSQLVSTASSTLSFACAGYGHPSPAITWQRNAVALSPSQSDGIVIQQSSIVKGGVTFVKSILQVCGSNSVAQYSCTVENGINSETADFHIFAEEVGGIIVAPEDLSSLPGDQVFLACAAIGGNDTEVAWTVDGEPLDDSRAIYRTEKLVRNGYPVIKVALDLCVEEGDGGTYACIARNELYTETVNFELTVNRQQFIPEVFESEVPEIIENSGANVSFTCRARGFPLPAISWFRAGMQLETDADQTRMMITETQNSDNDEVESILVIVGLDLQDSGKYICKAENVVGYTSSTFELSVIPLPPMTTGVRLSPAEVAFSHATYSGGLFCSICSLSVLITYLCSRMLRSLQIAVFLCNTCIALIALNISYLASYFAPLIQSFVACVFFSVLFHWLFLAASFALTVMAVMMVWSPQKHRKVIITTSLVLNWVLPLLIGVVSMGADFTSYNGTDPEFCRPVMMPFWIALIAVFAVTHLTTWAILFTALCINCMQHQKHSLKVWGVMIALLLFDVAWGTGLPGSTHTVDVGMTTRIILQCIFVIANALLGIILILFFCLLSVKVRGELCTKKDVIGPSTSADKIYDHILHQTGTADTSGENQTDQSVNTVCGDVEETFQAVYDM